MGRSDRREMLQVAVLDGVAGGAQVIKRCLHVAGIPDRNDVEQQAQAGRAVELTGKIAIGEHAALSIGDIARQAMDRFSITLACARPCADGVCPR